MQRLNLGEWCVYALTDCAPAPAACSYSFPDADLSAHAAAAARWFSGNLFRTRFGVFLLRGSAGDVLVDCGLGPGPDRYFPGLAGTLPTALEAAGSSLDRIAHVVFTHLHIDHIGWAMHLPAARFFVAAAEWAHWSRHGEAAGLPHHVKAVAANVAPLATAGRLVAVEDISAEILPGITLLPAEGHTPGHHAVLVSRKLLIAGDTWHNPAQIEVADWGHRADDDRARATATRRRLATLARAEEWFVAAGHFVEAASFGRIGAHGFEPIARP